MEGSGAAIGAAALAFAPLVRAKLARPPFAPAAVGVKTALFRSRLDRGRETEMRHRLAVPVPHDVRPNRSSDFSARADGDQVTGPPVSVDPGPCFRENKRVVPPVRAVKNTIAG